MRQTEGLGLDVLRSSRERGDFDVDRRPLGVATCRLVWFTARAAMFSTIRWRSLLQRAGRQIARGNDADGERARACVVAQT